MQSKYPIGILGATGMVGQRFIQLLENHPWFEVAWLAASDRSSGKTYGDAAKWRLDTPLPERIARMTVSPAEPEGAPKIIFAALDADIAREMEPRFAGAGLRRGLQLERLPHAPSVPLVIPEVNADHLHLIEEQSWRSESGGYMVTNPNCSAIGLVLALKPIEERFGIEQIFVTTMQAVSGAGYPGVPSMDILGNVVPYIKSEEEKMEAETLKLLGRFEGHAVTPLAARMSAHCNRVAVEDGHTESVSIKLGNKLAGRATKRCWRRGRSFAAGRAASAHGARAARRVCARRRSPAAAARSQSRPWHGRDCGPFAPVRLARLEVHRAFAQHHSRRGRRSHSERRVAGRAWASSELAGLRRDRSRIAATMQKWRDESRRRTGERVRVHLIVGLLLTIELNWDIRA